MFYEDEQPVVGAYGREHLGRLPERVEARAPAPSRSLLVALSVPPLSTPLSPRRRLLVTDPDPPGGPGPRPAPRGGFPGSPRGTPPVVYWDRREETERQATLRKP